MSKARITLSIEGMTHGGLRRFVEMTNWEDPETPLLLTRDAHGNIVGISAHADMTQIRPDRP